MQVPSRWLVEKCHAKLREEASIQAHNKIDAAIESGAVFAIEGDEWSDAHCRKYLLTQLRWLDSKMHVQTELCGVANVTSEQYSTAMWDLIAGTYSQYNLSQGPIVSFTFDHAQVLVKALETRDPHAISTGCSCHLLAKCGL